MVGATQPPPSETLEKVLLDLGLTPTEIQVYNFLLQVGRATPSVIARETHQSRGRIYQLMRRLVEMGFAMEEPTRPIQYSAVSLSGAVSLAAARISQQTRALQEMQAWVHRMEKATPPAPQKLARSRDIVVITGRRACNAELSRIINQARERLLLAGGARLIRRLHAAPTLLAEVANAARRGVHMEVRLSGDPTGIEGFEAVASRLGRDAISPAPSTWDGTLITAIAEAALIDILIQPDDDVPNRGDDVAVRVNNPTYAEARRARLGAPPAGP